MGDETLYDTFLAPFTFERTTTLEEVANVPVFLVSTLSSYASARS